MKREVLANDGYVFEKYHEFSGEVKLMLTQRLLLEELSLRIEKLPLCGEMTAIELQRYFTKVREQYLITRRAEDLTISEQYDMFKDLSSLDIDRTYPVELNIFVGSLGHLQRVGTISFNSFMGVPRNISGKLVDTPTVWAAQEGVSSVVNVIEELDRISNLSVEDPNPVGTNKLLRLAHFWASVHEMTGEVL